MTSFAQATRIIDEFVQSYYPTIPNDINDSPPPTLNRNSQNATPTSPRQRSRVPLLSALGLASCSTIHAPIQMPLFDNSAMDGYALRSWQSTQASPDNPLRFRVLGTIAAGDEPPFGSGTEDELTCWGIMTGAAFPLVEEGQVSEERDKYDACVKLELVTAQYGHAETATTSTPPATPEYITITAPVAHNANRRLAGEDIQIGDVLLRADEVVRKEHVMVLASMGVQEVEVAAGPTGTPLVRGGRRLKIGIINTGKEVVLNRTPPSAGSHDATKHEHPTAPTAPFPPTPTDLPTPPPSCPSSRSPSMTTPRPPRLGASQIWNSNGPYIHASLLTWGFNPQDIEVLTVPIAPGQDGDDPVAFQSVVACAVGSGYDVLISTGGVSMGVHDYVPSSIVALGGEIGFHKVRIRPGGPMMFAHLDNGGGRTAYFGLPGNPVAAAVCLRFMVAPALFKMRGGGMSQPDARMARIRVPGADNGSVEGTIIQRKPGLTRMYVPARLQRETDGDIPAVEALARGSNMTKALMNADCWVCFVEGDEADKVYEGDRVEVFGL